MIPETISYVNQKDLSKELQSFMTKVYGWMTIALLITGITASLTVSSQQLLYLILSNRALFFGLLIFELILVGSLVGFVHKVSSQIATLIFVFYAVLNGLTLSVLFVAYTSASIASTFFITALTFGAMSLYGYFTKKDLTKIGNFLFMALIGLIIASVINIFFQNSMLYWITTYVGVLIFVGLTAYDTQKIKNLYFTGENTSDVSKKSAIMGALTLYLDFINLFIMLLRILGNRR